MFEERPPTDASAEFDDDPSQEHVIHEIVSVVADVNDCDVMDLPPVSEVIDPDAVETVVQNPGANVVLGFEYAGGFVRVTSEGVVYERAGLSE
ncbi:HalOD1 output domain-containing protein [Halogeometricum limi]|uniref:Halobacterial output domain-containing protein n=1 Tax=Halogeometricum limi TaxID=555875 RepID=A0A1I6FVT6_9EURY|nr:HalOD1 output domain-containing protein [Halogeometricum limi]SFR34044.1 hypothetical protein SAMN04488124_0397 [Halogeometricum limi]